MPTAADALVRKAKRDHNAGEILVISPDLTVLDAAKVMNARRVGALPVLAAPGSLVGMFSERDVLTRVVASEKAPEATLVRDVMTSPVFACAPVTPIAEIRSIMSEKRIRHMPIVDGDELVGMLSMGDLLAEETHVMTQTISYLQQYMYAG